MSSPLSSRHLLCTHAVFERRHASRTRRVVVRLFRRNGRAVALCPDGTFRLPEVRTAAAAAEPICSRAAIKVVVGGRVFRARYHVIRFAAVREARPRAINAPNWTILATLKKPRRVRNTFMRTVNLRSLIIQTQYSGSTLVRHGHFRAVSRRVGNPRLDPDTVDVPQVAFQLVCKHNGVVRGTCRPFERLT